MVWMIAEFFAQKLVAYVIFIISKDIFNDLVGHHLAAAGMLFIGRKAGNYRKIAEQYAGYAHTEKIFL